MEKPEYFELKNEDLRKIRMYSYPIDAGSDVTCYLYENNQVIKLFEITCSHPEDKLFIPHKIYGNNSYTFVNKVGINYNGLTICYTMPYIRGEKLNYNVFNELSIDNLLSYIDTYLTDTNTISKQGIYTHDSFITNILINHTGFHNIDPIDFILSDEDASILEAKNNKIFFSNFWDFLLSKEVKTFCIKNKLSQNVLYTDPIYFFLRLTELVSNRYGEEINNVGKIRTLIKKNKRS